MSDAIEAQAGNPRPRADEVLRRKKIINAPLVPASEVREKDPATQAALVAAAWSGTVKGIIETGTLVMASLRAFSDDADRRDAFIVALVEKRVLTSREARRRLASPKLIKLRTIGENQALLLHEQVFGFLSSSYSLMYQLIMLWQQFPEADEQKKLARLVSILAEAPDEITREFLSDETERFKKARKSPETRRAPSPDPQGRIGGGQEQGQDDVEIALFTPTDRDLSALAMPYSMVDDLERRLPVLRLVRERERIGIMVVARISALPVIADKLLQQCGFSFEQARVFLVRRPDSADVTDAEAVIVAQRGDVGFDPPGAGLWLGEGILDSVIIASRLFSDAKKRLHVFARAHTPGWKCLVGAENWSQE